MNLAKLHEGEWLVSAETSEDNPKEVNIKARSIDGEILEYTVVTTRAGISRDHEIQRAVCHCE